MHINWHLHSLSLPMHDTFIHVQIRAAIYTLVFTCCKTVPAFVTSRAKHFCTLVLGSLGENDPGVVGVVWEAGLTVIATVEVRASHATYGITITCACMRMLLVLQPLVQSSHWFLETNPVIIDTWGCLLL